MEKRTVSREESFTIAMPKNLIIGDPWYFEKCPDRKDLFYNKAFRGRGSWVGRAIVSEVIYDYKDMKVTGTEFTLCFAQNEEDLAVYLDGMKYTRQTEKTLEIGVDTAKYIVETNISYDTFETGSDGYMGSVAEYYTKGKLEGIYIELSAGEYAELDNVVDKIKSIF